MYASSASMNLTKMKITFPFFIFAKLFHVEGHENRGI